MIPDPARVNKLLFWVITCALPKQDVEDAIGIFYALGY